MLYLSHADWSVTMRRVPEAMTAWLVPGGVLTLLVGLGAHTLYHWSHPRRSPGRAAHAQGALPEPAALLRPHRGELVAWTAFAWAMTGASRRQDKEGGVALTRRNRASRPPSSWSSPSP